MDIQIDFLAQSRALAMRLRHRWVAALVSTEICSPSYEGNSRLFGISTASMKATEPHFSPAQARKPIVKAGDKCEKGLSISSSTQETAFSAFQKSFLFWKT